MKKSLFLFAFISALSVAPLSALDFGIRGELGTDISLVNIYTYQDVTFKLENDSRIGFEAGVRVMENYSFSPYLYVNPMIQFDLKNWYLGGGLMFASDTQYSDDLLWFARTGFIFGNFEFGPGRGDIDLGFEVSPTVYIDDDEDDELSNSMGSIFGTIFNIFKINVGFSYYFPLKKY